LIVHIHPERTESKKLQDAVDKILVELSNKANYPNIYYRLIKNNHIEAGLEHVCENSQVDILAMAHRQHGFFDNIFKGSFTKRMADITNTPLLVFPAVS
jgi:nucleotide-binding universal stress UspA family protein